MTTPRIHSLAAALLVALATPAISQDKPSMNPDAGSTGSANPLGGMTGIGKDRPADAKTEITAKTEAMFDNAANLAEFTGSVVVRDSQFTLTCDKLRVILNKDRKGLERAEATGNVVIIQENTSNSGQTTKAIGRAGVATYVPSTGEVKLRIWPSVQQGMNNQVATEESTVMTLNRNGKSTTVGGSKTVITDTSDKSSAR